jgi:uncharacterized protein (TIGR03435 family)
MRISILAALLATGLFAQTPAFEVVSVKRVVLPPGQMIFHFSDKATRKLQTTGNRLTLRRFTLSDLILWAYDLDDYQILGLPAWGKPGQELYDVDAKTEGDTSPPPDQLRLMLQTMLADRFQLKVHRESRELPLYYLVIGKNGLKMKEVVPDPAPGETSAAGGRGAAAPMASRPATTYSKTTDGSDERVLKGGMSGLVRLSLSSWTTR